MRWAVAITTVPQRRCDLLPQTLHSLREGGFGLDANCPMRLHVDGSSDPRGWAAEFGLPVTAHDPPVRTAGNWCLALAETWFRHQEADMYMMCQDDFVCVRNLRQYLDRCPYPERGYLNLITETGSAAGAQRHPRGKPTNEELRVQHGKVGWFRSNQSGKGAVALVLDKKAVMALLSPYPGKPHSHLAERTMDAHRGWRVIDGGISESMTTKGWSEWCHNPSLVLHTGVASSMGNCGGYEPAQSFPGDQADALGFLR